MQHNILGICSTLFDPLWSVSSPFYLFFSYHFNLCNPAANPQLQDILNILTLDCFDSTIPLAEKNPNTSVGDDYLLSLNAHQRLGRLAGGCRQDVFPNSPLTRCCGGSVCFCPLLTTHKPDICCLYFRVGIDAYHDVGRRCVRQQD